MNIQRKSYDDLHVVGSWWDSLPFRDVQELQFHHQRTLGLPGDRLGAAGGRASQPEGAANR